MSKKNKKSFDINAITTNVIEFSELGNSIAHAVSFLKSNHDGMVKNVFYRSEIGAIDLIWGDSKRGLCHIQKKHIIQQNDFPNLYVAMLIVKEVLENGNIIPQGNKRRIEYLDYVVALVLDTNNNWIITAFDNRIGITSLHTERDITENGTIVSQTDNAKVSKKNETSKENQQKNLGATDIDTMIAQIMQAVNANPNANVIAIDSTKPKTDYKVGDWVKTSKYNIIYQIIEKNGDYVKLSNGQEFTKIKGDWVKVDCNIKPKCPIGTQTNRGRLEEYYFDTEEIRYNTTQDYHLHDIDIVPLPQKERDPNKPRRKDIVLMLKEAKLLEKAESEYMEFFVNNRNVYCEICEEQNEVVLFPKDNYKQKTFKELGKAALQYCKKAHSDSDRYEDMATESFDMDDLPAFRKWIEEHGFTKALNGLGAIDWDNPQQLQTHMILDGKFNKDLPAFTDIKAGDWICVDGHEDKAYRVLRMPKPFINTPLEVYSMLSLVAMDELKRRNIDNVHRFFETFVNEEYEEIVNSSLNIKYDYVTKSFKNRLALQSLIYGNFDYKTGEEAGVKRPAKINIPLLYYRGKRLPKDKQMLSYLSFNDRQEENQQIINFLINHSGEYEGKGADSQFSGMNSSLDNALSPFLFKLDKDGITKSKIADYFWTNQGIRLDEGAIDRFIENVNMPPAGASDFVNESPKIKFACECIKSVKAWHDKRNEEMSGQVIYINRGVKYFDYIKEYLNKMCGFKSKLKYEYEDADGTHTASVDEVMCIASGINSDEKKKSIVMNAFNEGLVKIIIGSDTIKEGVNLQKRSTCLYYLYPNWNPTDVQQVEGRIYRQGNMYQYVRIIIPLMQNSMDTFIFQKLQEKTDRINDIWYKLDRGNVLNVDSLDPKEVKFALITDINQLASLEISKEKENVDRDVAILNDEINSLSNFSFNLAQLNEAREQVLDQMRKNVQTMVEYIPTLQNRPTQDVLEQMKAEERHKIESLLERYDAIVDFLNSNNYEDKEITAYSRKLGNLYASHDMGYTTKFTERLKSVKKIEDSVLVKRGYNRNSNIEEVVNKLKEAKKEKTDELERLNSKQHFKEVYEYIESEKAKLNVIGKSIKDRLKEFIKTNNVMAYLFDPNKEVHNNEFPEDMKEYTDFSTISNDDDDDAENWEDEDYSYSVNLTDEGGTTHTIKSNIKRNAKYPLLEKYKYLDIFMGKMQKPVVEEILSNEKRMGEDGYARDMQRLDEQLRNIPTKHQKHDDALDAIVYAHYFGGATDFFVTEYDKSSNEVFGYCILNGDCENAELGYSSVAELAQYYELDFYWQEKSIYTARAEACPDYWKPTTNQILSKILEKELALFEK